VDSAGYADTTAVRVLPLIVVLALASGACAARGNVPRPFPGAAVPPAGREAPPERIDPIGEAADAPALTAPPAAPKTGLTAVVQTALGYLGVPYRNGGSDPTGFDCSGFVQWVFARLGVALPREVRDQYQVGRKVPMDDVKEGDLLFFQTVRRGASHVAMALGDGRFVHAPSSQGVVRVERYTSYWASRFLGARRIDDVSDSPRIILPGSVRSAR
jgi:cell wall-associated NlpC family hydrolase